MLCLEATSKLHNFVKNQDKLLSNSDEMQKLELFVQCLEKLNNSDEMDKVNSCYGVKKGNELTNSHIIGKMRHQLKIQQDEIERLEKDKNALLDEIFKCKTQNSVGLNDSNMTSGFFE